MRVRCRSWLNALSAIFKLKNEQILGAQISVCGHFRARFIETYVFSGAKISKSRMLQALFFTKRLKDSRYSYSGCLGIFRCFVLEMVY